MVRTDSEDIFGLYVDALYRLKEQGMLHEDQERFLRDAKKANELALKEFKEKHYPDYLSDWLSKNMDKIMHTDLEDPKSFFKELYLKTSSHPGLKESYRKAGEAWKEVLGYKGSNVPVDFSFLGLFLLFLQNLTQINKLVEAISKEGEKLVKTGIYDYRAYRIERIANNYLKEQGINPTPEQRLALIGKLKEFYYSDQEVDKDTIHSLINNTLGMRAGVKAGRENTTEGDVLVSEHVTQDGQKLTAFTNKRNIPSIPHKPQPKIV